MKNSQKTFILVETVLAVMVVILAFAMIGERNGEARDKISVIVRDSDDSQWTAFKYGLRMAAEDQEAEMSVVSTGSVLTVEEEKNLIENEIRNGADAVILQPVPGEGAEEMVKEAAKKSLIVLVETTVLEEGSDSDIALIGPDNYGLGVTLAEELLKDFDGNIQGKTLGILSETTDSEAVTSRERGVMDKLESEGAEFIWSVSGSFGERGGDALQSQPQVDIVIALDDSSLNTAGEASASNNLDGALVYGIGNSTEAIYYVDTGAVECIVLPDEFDVGYKSLTEASQSLKGVFRQPESGSVSHAVVRRETLFSEENQKILYTMSQ